MVKIGSDNYYLGDLQEKNYAIKHINRLLTQPAMKQGDIEDEEEEDISLPSPTKPKGRPPVKSSPTPPTSPPPTPITTTPEDEG